MNILLFQFLPAMKNLNLGSDFCISPKFQNISLQTVSDQMNLEMCKFEEEENSNLDLICESVSSYCYLNGTTSISKKGETFHFMLDQSINGLYMSGNKRIEYLPVNVHRNFPNIKQYLAEDCSIREISRKNFEKLYEVSEIRLRENQIEKIPSDTFADLPLLLYIGLRKLKSNYS